MYEHLRPVAFVSPFLLFSLRQTKTHIFGRFLSEFRLLEGLVKRLFLERVYFTTLLTFVGRVGVGGSAD